MLVRIPFVKPVLQTLNLLLCVHNRQMQFIVLLHHPRNLVLECVVEEPLAFGKLAAASVFDVAIDDR